MVFININKHYLNILNNSPQSSLRLLHHDPSLDSLRGIAVTLVFLFHAQIPGFSGAFIGVDIFFVLSGFLITLILLQEHQVTGSINLPKFYIRRILRLIPGLVFMLVIFLIVYIVLFHDAAAQLRQLQDALLTLFYIANWTRAFDLNRPVLLSHTWSLSIEEQFYLVWPIIMRCLLPLSGFLRSLIIITLFLFSWGWRIILLYDGASWNRLYNGLDCRADMLLAGCFLASLWHAGYLDVWKRSRFSSKVLVILACFGLAFLIGLVDWQKPQLYLWQYPLVAFATVIVILKIVSFPAGMFSRSLNQRWLVWLGKVSYGIYLWHFPILGLLREIGFAVNFRPLIAALLTLTFATLSWYGIERPFLRLKHKFK